MEELQNWIRENCLDSKKKLGGKFIKNNGETTKEQFPLIYDKILYLTSNLDEIYQDFTFSKRLHFILDNQHKIKELIKKESFFKENILFWIEDCLYNKETKKLNRVAFSNNAKFIKDKYPNLYKKVCILTNFLEGDISFAQRIWHVYNNQYSYPKCEWCSKDNHSFTGFKNGYFRFCCTSCGAHGGLEKSKETRFEKYGDETYTNRLKFRETCLKEYGVENPLQYEPTKEKIKRTKKKRYGNENYNNPEKTKETNLERYGVECSLQNEEIKVKAEETKMEKYGSPYFNNPEKRKETNKEKYGDPEYRNFEQCKETKKERYGNPFYTNLEKIKKTNLKRYGFEYQIQSRHIQRKIKLTNIKNTGFEYPFQNPETQRKIRINYFNKHGVYHHLHVPEIAEKCLGWHKNSWHEYTLPSGKVIKLQGFEPKALDILLTEYSEDEILYKRSDMPRLFYTDTGEKERRYYPDFYIPKDNLLIEVKSTYTYEASLEKNLLKEQCAIDQGFNYKLMIL